MSLHTSNEIMSELYTQLEKIHSYLNEEEIDANLPIQHVSSLAHHFSHLESIVLNQDQMHLDEILTKKMLTVIQDIRATPALETLLGTMQTDFYHLLHRIEHTVSREAKGKKVERVYNERLDF